MVDVGFRVVLLASSEGKQEMSEAKYNLGDVVVVQHKQGYRWMGQVTYRANTDGDDWEYEVSNSPYDRARVDLLQRPVHEIKPGFRWSPLVWENEILGKVPDYGADC